MNAASQINKYYTFRWVHPTEVNHSVTLLFIDLFLHHSKLRVRNYNLTSSKVLRYFVLVGDFNITFSDSSHLSFLTGFVTFYHLLVLLSGC